MRMTMRALALLLLGLLAACGRPLTEAERALSAGIFGDTVDPAPVRVAAGFGLLPPPETVPEAARTVPLRPDPCARTAPQTERAREFPPAFAVRDSIFLRRRDIYASETVPGWPDLARVPHVFILAHELVHVWQWQNREVTGYRPARAFAEGLRIVDPYFYRVTEERAFLQYGYEQQAAILEDWLCYALFDPGDPKRAMLERILAPHFPLGRAD